MKLFDKILNGYNHLIAKQLRLPSGLLARYVGNAMNKSNKVLYQLTLNNINIKDGDNILEVGFGNGRFFSDLNNRGANLTITGIDQSPEMVTEAINNNKALYQKGRIKLSVGSSISMPYENDSFDKVICINVIYFWENPELHLKEVLRVLKPDGYFCTGFRPKENLSKFHFSKFGFTLYAEEEWIALLEKNGFHLIRSLNGKSLKNNIDQKNSPFDSLCIISLKK